MQLEAAALTKDRHFLQERLVELSLSHGALHEDTAIGIPVYGPQLDVSLGFDGGSSRSAVDEGQLPKTSCLADAAHGLLAHVYLRKSKLIL